MVVRVVPAEQEARLEASRTVRQLPEVPVAPEVWAVRCPLVVLLDLTVSLRLLRLLLIHMQQRVLLWLVEMEAPEVLAEPEVTVLRVQITRAELAAPAELVVREQLRLPHRYRQEDSLVKMFLEQLRRAMQKRGQSLRREALAVRPRLVVPEVLERVLH
jgi:hypothetical protein